MRAVVQRVTQASVVVNAVRVGEIGPGVLVLLGVAKGDTAADAEYLARKIVELRIFNDEGGKMNLSVQDVGGSLLAVSQFTLYGDCRKGRRPGYDAAAAPEEARGLYEHFVGAVRATGLHVATGVFQAHMEVHLLNDGPVTLIIESPNRSA